MGSCLHMGKHVCCCLQNILYQPFGLKCGHRFCKTCVLNAIGLRGMYGDPERVLAAIVDSNAKCPECEQAGMFKGAVYLEQVHQLVKQRQVTPQHTLAYA